jgi:multidrug resistance efflux pump
VTSKISGLVTAVEVKEGSEVSEGQELARVSDVESRRRLAELKLRIVDKKELLRIMRTTGTVQDERKQRRIVIDLTARLRRLRRSCPAGGACQGDIGRIEQQIKSARLKLKFCEWQAEPDEIKDVGGKVTKLEQKLAELSGRPMEAKIASSRGGLVTGVKIAKGKKVARGAVLATLAEAGRFRVEAFYTEAGAGEPLDAAAAAASVRLVGKAGARTFLANPGAKRRGNALLFDVPGDAGSVSSGDACQVEFTKGRISLFGSWVE